MWFSIHYFCTAGAAVSQRIYYESTQDTEHSVLKYGKWILDVKLGVGRFPKEVSLPPKL